MQDFPEPVKLIALEIWDKKYRFEGEPTPSHTWRRVAKAVGGAENEDAYFALLDSGKFSPAGRIISGAGTRRNVTLFNCFVMDTIPDSMSGIFRNVSEAALAMQAGGGIGHDFSSLRPKGARVEGVGAEASGPVSFMHVWDSTCRTIMSAGVRRGAMMATLRCDHPDVEEFIEAKRNPAHLRMFNVSVTVTDAFMEAVRANMPWPLVFAGRVFKIVDARELWDKILRSAYEYAEPGVIFIDRVNALNNLREVETIAATNPCGEQPLPPYGACLLGSINLARLVENPFTPDAALNVPELAKATALAVRFLDQVIDVSRYPLVEQEKEARAKRRVGLGVTGLADALIMCRVKYNSREGVAMAKAWMRTIENAAYIASAKIAGEKEPYPLWDVEAFKRTATYNRLLPEVIQEIGRHGLRNGLLTSIAPTGTISLFAGNVSSGIEPVFALSYKRKVLQADGSRETREVQDFAYAEYRRLFGEKAALPDYFVTVADMTPQSHIDMQAALQAHVDSSISKTVNVPEAWTFEQFRDLYDLAYDSGCKGCTAYRPNDVTGSVLSVGDEKPVVKGPLPRDEQLYGSTYKISWPNSPHALYITINDTIQDGARRPFEIFINSKNTDAFAWTVALTRMVSAIFRRDADVAFVVEELKAVFDPGGGAFYKGKYVPSLLAVIGDVIERHLRGIGYFPQETETAAIISDKQRKRAEKLSAIKPAQCPKCHEFALVRSEGCDKCQSCDYSKCS